MTKVSPTTSEWPQWLKDNDWLLSRLEYLWSYMKRQVHKTFSDLLDMPGGPAVVKEHWQMRYKRFGRTSQSRLQSLSLYTVITAG